jgi:predicted 3-demethylubiquinone-9 3-methyltransferase (glyoxalase superfamily)
MQKITPFLWFDGNAEEAMNFYTSVFSDAKVLSVSRYPAGGPAPAGSVMTAQFELGGLEFTALNAGPMYAHLFNPSISFVVACDTQEEVDRYWDALTKDGGQESQCGWLVDKFGLSWQISPKVLLEYMTQQDATKAAKVMAAMSQMKKINIAAIEAANSAQ